MLSDMMINCSKEDLPEQRHGHDILARLKVELKKTSQEKAGGCFSAPEKWRGWGEVIHGGYQAILLANVVQWIDNHLVGMGETFFQDMRIRFKKPAFVKRQLLLLGTVVRKDDSVVELRSEIRDEENRLYTQVDMTSSLTDAAIVPVGPDRMEENQRCPLKFTPPDTSHWPDWHPCCREPLHRLWKRPVRWQMDTNGSSLAGRCQVPGDDGSGTYGLMAALCDQGFGQLGLMQNIGMMMTTRLNLKVHAACKKDTELQIYVRGHRWLDGPFRGKAWLWQDSELIAQADCHFVCSR